MSGRTKRLIEERNRAEGVAGERLDVITELERRLDEVHRRLEAQRDETRRAYAENARLRMQRDDLAEHLKHAVDERDALQVQVEAMTRDLIAVADGTCRHEAPMRAIGDALAVVEWGHDKDPRWVIDQMVRALAGVDYEAWKAAYEADGATWDPGPLPRLSGPSACAKCGGGRRLGDESDGGRPCPDCCCPDCGVFSGDGRPCASHGPTEDNARNCDRCKNARKVDVGEDHLGPLDIPCDVCCCYVCGDYTGGGLCELDKGETP